MRAKRGSSSKRNEGIESLVCSASKGKGEEREEVCIVKKRERSVGFEEERIVREKEEGMERTKARKWKERDEIAFLNAIFDCSKKGEPLPSYTILCNHCQNILDSQYTYTQLYSKLKWFKKKYKDITERKKKIEFSFKNPHENTVYNLCKQIWESDQNVLKPDAGAHDFDDVQDNVGKGELHSNVELFELIKNILKKYMDDLKRFYQETFEENTQTARRYKVELLIERHIG